MKKEYTNYPISSIRIPKDIWKKIKVKGLKEEKKYGRIVCEILEEYFRRK